MSVREVGTMDAGERQREILARLQTNPVIKIRDISLDLDVSRETIRKDISDLADRDLLVKVRGGAARATNKESAYDRRKTLHSGAKQSIARVAAELVDGHSTVYLDYGTTTYMLAAQLKARDPDITIVSCALPIISMLLPCKNIDMIVPGGIVRKNENSLYGPFTQHCLSNVYFDIGFFGCAGLHPAAGVTNHHALETAISTLAMDQSQRVVLITDSAKVGRIAANKTTALATLDDVVIDREPPEELAAAFKEQNIRVHLA